MSKREQRIETFCNELFKTNNQRRAYRAAYPSSIHWKDSTVDSKASEFAKNDKVLERLAELRKEAAEENRISRNDLIAQLKNIGFADIELENIKPADKIKAIELIAKMLGFDKPETENNDGMIRELLEGLKKA